MKIALVMLLVFGPITLNAQKKPEYRVSLSLVRPLMATVAAHMTIPDGKLFMDPTGLDTKDGWAEYIKDLQVHDDAGRRLVPKLVGKAEWIVDGAGAGPLEVTYKVDLSFAASKDNSSDLRMGKVVGDSLFLVNRALFVLSNSPGTRAIVFDVPSDWQIATSWSSTGPQSFEAHDNRELSFNTCVFGHYKTLGFQSGAVSLTLALLGEMGEVSALVAPPLRDALQEYVRLFPKTPSRHILITFFYGAAENGESFSNGSSLTTAERLTPDGLIIWGNFLAHELFHNWNGQQIRGQAIDDRQWMSEGFTEYIANRTLVRTGQISNELFIKKMEKHLEMYLYYNWAPPFEGVSLKAAGARKGYYRPGVYSGGWAAAFCLDVTIRTLTANRRSIDDYFSLLYDSFGLTGKLYTYDDLVRTAAAASGHDMTEFFAKYISGTDQMPVLECLREAGYEGFAKNYSGELYIFPVAVPTAEQLVIRDSFQHIQQPE
jgi:predicted metalloprotease with PDZ domain